MVYLIVLHKFAVIEIANKKILFNLDGYSPKNKSNSNLLETCDVRQPVIFECFYFSPRFYGEAYLREVWHIIPITNYTNKLEWS